MATAHPDSLKKLYSWRKKKNTNWNKLWKNAEKEVEKTGKHGTANRKLGKAIAEDTKKQKQLDVLGKLRTQPRKKQKKK